MRAWKKIFELLSQGEFFARCHTVSGGYYYMYLPKIADIGNDSLCGEYSARYDDISKIEILKFFSHANINIDSDLDLAESYLETLKNVKLQRAGDSLFIEPESI